MDSRAIAELVLQLGRIASSESLVEGLTPVQWAGLRYFGRANRFSRTPSAFAAFHGTTRGTASQTIKNLEALGYLARKRSETDRRSVHLVLTEKARAIFEKDLFETLIRAVDTLSPSVQGQVGSALQRMLGQMAVERGLPTFGNCVSCTHLEGDDCSREKQETYACGFSGEPLRLEELDGVCINFVQGKPLPESDSAIGTSPRWTPILASAIAIDDNPTQPTNPAQPTNQKNPESPTQALECRLRAHLQALAALRTPITYRDLAKAMLLSPPHTIHQVTEALEQLMAEDAASARPFIAAMVVSTWRGGLPAPGFFDCAARLGRFAGDASGLGAKAFYAGEFDATVALWAGPCPTADTT